MVIQLFPEEHGEILGEQKVTMEGLQEVTNVLSNGTIRNPL